MERCEELNYTGIKRTALEEENENQALHRLVMTKQKDSRFVVCVANTDCEDLEVRKIYQTLSDEAAAADGLVRIVDESGEDYLYPAELFIQIELPQALENALMPAA